jgi:pimeloyl-ACP methyl ester carboxylesterase
VPGDADLPGGVAGDQTGVETLRPPVGQLLMAAAQQAPDLVQRVVLVSAPGQGVLLDPAAHFVDDYGVQLDDVERVRHRGGVRELVADRVAVAPK